MMDKAELQKLQDYLRRLFGNAGVTVKARPKLKDSAEVFIGDEFVGIISLDEEDGEAIALVEVGDDGEDLPHDQRCKSQRRLIE